MESGTGVSFPSMQVCIENSNYLISLTNDLILCNHRGIAQINVCKIGEISGLSRCGKSCRLRWKNYLQPDVKRGNFTKEEEDIIINLHNQLGKK